MWLLDSQDTELKNHDVMYLLQSFVCFVIAANAIAKTEINERKNGIFFCSFARYVRYPT